MSEPKVEKAIPGVLVIAPPIPKRCPIHGPISDGWVAFWIGDTATPNYCIRCICETFERMGVSRVTDDA
jgi:hypothetical protein